MKLDKVFKFRIDSELHKLLVKAGSEKIRTILRIELTSKTTTKKADIKPIEPAKIQNSNIDLELLRDCDSYSARGQFCAKGRSVVTCNGVLDNCDYVNK